MSYLRIGITATVSPDHDHFEVWRHTANLTSLDVVHLVAARVGEDVRDRTFVDTSVEAGEDYWYWIRSVDQWGNKSAFIALGSETAPVINTEISEDVLLGRDSAGDGPVEEIAVTAPLAFTGAQAIHITLGEPGFIGRSTASAGVATDLTVSESLAVLGFTDAIFDKTAPGDIGGATPGNGTFSKVIASGGSGSELARLTAANGAIVLEGANGGGALPIFTLSWENTDVTTYVAARIASHNTGGSDDGDLRFSTCQGGTLAEQVRIDEDGNVGIGSFPPGQKLDVDGVIRRKSYTVAALPSGAAGDISYASDGLKDGESTGSGTGVPVYHDGTAWRRFSDDTTVSA